MDRSLWKERVRAALQAGQLTAAAFAFAHEMLRYANRAGQLFPSRATLAAGIGRSEKTAERATVELRDAGLLVWQQRRSRWNRMRTNLYTLTVPKRSAVEREVHKQLKNKEDKLLVRSSVTMTDGSLKPGLAAALARLGALLGVPPGQVLPGLPGPIGGGQPGRISPQPS